MGVYKRFLEPVNLAQPYDEGDVDFATQTGGDWYTTMLAASLGGKNIEGASMSGSSEVLMKVSYEFAEKKATGKILVKKRDKLTPKLKPGSNLVAKLGKKFRGVGKANSFSVLMESSLWGSNTTNRLKSSAFLAASMIGMGINDQTARTVVSDVMACEIPAEVVAAVSMPLSLLKRDTAVLAKTRAAVFVPHHVIQDVVWEDGQLVLPENNSRDAIDWARVTAVAKYIGASNSLACDKFALVAERHGVNYALVNNHWAMVTNQPYDELAAWEMTGSAPMVEKMFLENMSLALESGLSAMKVTASDLVGVNNSPTVENLMAALQSIKLKKDRKFKRLAIGTDVLAPLDSHSVDPSKAAMLVKGSESAYNALRSAMMEKLTKSQRALKLSNTLLEMGSRWYVSESELNPVVKELAELLVTQDVFLRAVNILASTLEDLALAQFRVARLKRSLLGTSSALGDRFPITLNALPTLAPLLSKVADSVINGNTGVMAPPPILADPVAAIQAGELARLLKEAATYLAEAKDYWASRYQAKATKFKDRDIAKSVKYGVAASAMRAVEANWLAMPDTAYHPPAIATDSFVVSMLKNYTRKRASDTASIAPKPNETLMEYATRMDEVYKPKVAFLSAVEFAMSKVAMLAEDFSKGIPVSESELDDDPTIEETVAPPVKASANLSAFADFFAAMDANMGKAAATTSDDVMATWPDEASAKAAAVANGYSDFGAAYSKLGDATAYDEENSFTREYLKAVREAEATTMSEALSEVI